MKRPKNLRLLAVEDEATLTDLRVAALDGAELGAGDRFRAWLVAANRYGYTMQALGDTIGVSHARIQQLIATAPTTHPELPPVVGIYRQLQDPPDPAVRRAELAARAGIPGQPVGRRTFGQRLTGPARDWHRLTAPQRAVLLHRYLPAHERPPLRVQNWSSTTRSLRRLELLGEPGRGGWPPLTERGQLLAEWADTQGLVARLGPVVEGPEPAAPEQRGYARAGVDGAIETGVYEINRDGTLGRLLVES